MEDRMTGAGAALAAEPLRRIQREITARGLDGWLLYDFHGLNPVATRVLGLGGGLATRRLFVLIPAAGAPVAVAHRIELHRIEGFPGEVRPYAAWNELEGELRSLLQGRRVAMEYSPGDAVPYMDRVPAGVLELVRASGAEVVPSSTLVTLIAARWTDSELAGHRKAAELLRTIALEAFRQAGQWIATTDARASEQGVQALVLEAFERAGLVTNSPPIVAVGANSANPHHEPAAGLVTPIGRDQVLLLDLWAGVSRGAVYADQTWMAWTGSAPGAEVSRVFEVVRAARDSAVALAAARFAGSEAVTGAELDDAARGVIRAAGLGEYFVHRTGHSIDQDLHGSGPHLDNFETRDDRELALGIGFSVEPGVYLPGKFGVRSEINVVLTATGPEVTPRQPQEVLWRMDAGAATA
jgi:Xaa-Pro dipeptidase